MISVEMAPVLEDPLAGTMFADPEENGAFRAWIMFYNVLSLVGMGAGVYHGYKRNDDSIGWAVAWGIFGGLLPVISIPISLAQGFGKEK